MLKPPALRGSTGSHSLQSIAALEAAWRTAQGISFLPHRNVVFVVDDDAAMLRSVARMLRQFGYASLLFPSAEAFANRSDFDRAVCVLLDINLGDGSGIELRHRLNAAGNTVPVIYMTGNDTPAVRTSALQSGCLAYLTKPFSAKSLIEPLERASAGLA
jgi:FixJ family two-component response regulator